jgi:glycosyltransferase involved in cell wall biosynthesis
MNVVTVIIPTIGRLSLDRTLDSVMCQLRPDDRVMVVGDGYQPLSRDQCNKRGPQVAYGEINPPAHNWGHNQRNWAMRQASGTHIAFLDDDDIWVPGAREALEVAAPIPTIYRMRIPNNGMLWRRPHLQEGNVGTPMIVVPNVPERFGVWGDRYEGDFDFISSTVAAWGGNVEWREEFLCHVRPDLDVHA